MKSNYIKKHLVVFLIVSIVLLVIVGCGNNSQKSAELSRAEILEILSGVVGGEEVLREAGEAYFAALSTENNNIVTPAKVNELSQSGLKDIYLLDIRQPEDFAKGRIKGANNIFWFDVGGKLDSLPKDKHIIVYCYSGQSAGQVVGALNVMGYKASSMSGGWNGGWVANNMPIEN